MPLAKATNKCYKKTTKICELISNWCAPLAKTEFGCGPKSNQVNMVILIGVRFPSCQGCCTFTKYVY